MALTSGQQACIRTLDRSLVVAAGAGSGKTFTLTQRIAFALESGALDDIERVCAITFTNKAAGELKARITAELRARGLADQALKVDDAWISTIHGMCARILRAHALELDLDPAFEMADPTLANTLRDRAVEAVLERAQLENGDDSDSYGISAQAVEALFEEYPARSYGSYGSSVESMLTTLMDAAGSSPRGFDALVVCDAKANPERLVGAVLDAFDGLVALVSAQKPNGAREAWAAKTAAQTAALRDAWQQGHAADVLWALHALDELSFPRKAGTDAFIAQVGEVQQLYRNCIMELRLVAAQPHLETLVSLARYAQELFSLEKRVAGVLDNDDLLVMAYRAISERPELAALYADKFQLVMVDEFQDTDQMQVDMIKLLAGPGACRLCTVGDAQQSIYRFRGADVSVYRRHLESVREVSPDDIVNLPHNFRSHQDVLALVDRVFERPEMFGGEFMSLEPARDEARVKLPFAEDVPRVQVQLTSNSPKGPSADQMREIAAARIAQTFADLRDRDHSAGEMALLLGSMSYADVYARALRACGLPCVITGGSVFARTPEAALVLDLARIVANPYRTQALHNVLTSPLFELSAGDLLFLTTVLDQDDGMPRQQNLCAGLMTASRTLREQGAQQAWSARLVLALRVMGEVLEGSGRTVTSRLVMRVLVDSGWLSRMQERGPEGLAAVGNAYKAVRMLEEIEDSSAAGSSRVAQRFEARLLESKEAPGALSATDGDFVRIMTVHASKGLEFPIVAVAEFRESGGPSSKLLASSIDGEVYLSLDLGNTVNMLEGSAKLGGYPKLYAALTEDIVGEEELALAVKRADRALDLRAALYGYEREGDAEESKRLLYVALTRAQEALVVSLMGKRTKDNPLGTPKSCLGAVVEALAGLGNGFDAGVSHFEFGGTAPASVEHVALESAEPAEQGESDEAATKDAKAPCSYSEEAFAIPAPESRPRISRTPYVPAHDGIFSYSSIAEASHGSDVVRNLAARHFVSADESEVQQVFTLSLIATDEGGEAHGFERGWHEADLVAATADEDDGAWAYRKAPCADSDKATDLGTAFHRLAQYAVVTRGSFGLVRPSKERISFIARACKLDEAQVGRLNEALDRWFASDIASQMREFDDLRAEVPFFLQLPIEGDESPAFLEGEIDLLGISDDGERAVVVDYKTGGRADETEEELAEKHVLQAACYALAIMKQGVSSVEAVFVRVERPRADASDQPQCVRYRFESDDIAELAQAIAATYASQ